MIQLVQDLGPGVRADCDTIIDVRSPAEFAEDHAPGALNLPVLDDAERAEVGTTYVQDDPFLARRLGAAKVARNIAAHLEGPLAGRPGGWRPLLYCWRGGQRSHAFATVLDQVGWRTRLLSGGYRTYRRGVVRALYEAAAPSGIVLLDGGTGTGKTEVLGALARLGVQVLDLEDLARHRGSLLGALPGEPQPSQKLFESRLAAALAPLDPARPIVVEAESSRIGERALPSRLWAAMSGAPRITLAAPLAERARYLAQLYAEAAQDRAGLRDLLGRMPRHIGRAEVDAWRDLLAAGELEALAAALIERHYDPAYRRGADARARPRLGVVEVEGLTPAGFARAAEQVAHLLPPVAQRLGSTAGGREEAAR